MLKLKVQEKKVIWADWSMKHVSLDQVQSLTQFSSIHNVQRSTENLVEIGHFSDVNENRPVLDANGCTKVDLIVLPWHFGNCNVFPDLEFSRLYFTPQIPNWKIVGPVGRIDLKKSPKPRLSFHSLSPFKSWGLVLMRNRKVVFGRWEGGGERVKEGRVQFSLSFYGGHNLLKGVLTNWKQGIFLAPTNRGLWLNSCSYCTLDHFTSTNSTHRIFSKKYGSQFLKNLALHANFDDFRNEDVSKWTKTTFTLKM